MQQREASEEQHGSVHVCPAPATLKEAPVVFQINQQPGIPPLWPGVATADGLDLLVPESTTHRFPRCDPGWRPP